jgi:hypothetical protein
VQSSHQCAVEPQASSYNCHKPGSQAFLAHHCCWSRTGARSELQSVLLTYGVRKPRVSPVVGWVGPDACEQEGAPDPGNGL